MTRSIGLVMGFRHQSEAEAGISFHDTPIYRPTVMPKLLSAIKVYNQVRSKFRKRRSLKEGLSVGDVEALT